MTESQKKLAKKNGTMSKVYGDLVNQKIRERYTLSEELALLRQREDKPDEYAEYHAYVESCKSEAKDMLGIRGDG